MNQFHDADASLQLSVVWSFDAGRQSASAEMMAAAVLDSNGRFRLDDDSH
jgi:hypothetical protein